MIHLEFDPRAGDDDVEIFKLQILARRRHQVGCLIVPPADVELGRSRAQPLRNADAMKPCRTAADNRVAVRDCQAGPNILVLTIVER